MFLKVYAATLQILTAGALLMTGVVQAQDRQPWTWSPELLKPFWLSQVVYDEPVLFVRDAEDQVAKASLLFPVQKIIAVHDASGEVSFQPDTDFQFEPGRRQIVVPHGSRIVSYAAKDLRRPAGSQKYRLTHRDGNGEILFGAKLEYHNMQTMVTYVKAVDEWPVKMPKFDADVLPRTVQRLQTAQPVSIVLLGDSISTGCNASGWGEGAPYQPPWQDLLLMHLQHCCEGDVRLTNLAVGGTSTPWGLTMIDQVVAQKPDLVLLAFGMNDSAGRSAAEYGQNTAAMIAKIREGRPEAEFILIASMLGNRDWTTLKHDVFPDYRNELAKLAGRGIALADMTSVWTEFLKRKKDRDLTGNGVNHPNDFGHRVYAQVLAALLTDPEFVAE
ncbi:MAG: SGNH/GDSL hydrolase family protein [Fuerstiella sp.]